MNLDLTIVNYRCFAADAPIHWELRPGMTGIVGPNNSGKSTFLRFFFEFRELFRALEDPNTRKSLGNGATRTFNFPSVGDAAEIHCDRNQQNLRIEIRVQDASENQISGLILEAPQHNGSSFRCIFLVGPTFARIAYADQGYPKYKTGGNILTLDEKLFESMCQCIGNSMYLPATRIAIGESQGDIYDLAFGSKFIQQWDAWKTGNNRAHNASIQRVTEDIGKLFGFDRLEITATPDKRDLHVVVNNRPYKLRELGAGLAQFVLVLANVTIRKPTYLFIDEPEISLHPSLQLDFLTALTSYASVGTVFATHSIGLARSADRVSSLYRVDGIPRFRPFEDTPSFAEFLGEMSFSAYRDLGFDSVLLVEGVNDIRTVQQFLRLLKKEHRVVLFHLGGSQLIRRNRALELSEVLRLTKSVHVLIDSERTSKNAPIAKNRIEFLDTCATLGIRAHCTERRAIENYIVDHAIKAELGKALRALGEYEDRRDPSVGWSKTDGWRAARVMSADELLATDVGKFLTGV